MNPMKTCLNYILHQKQKFNLLNENASLDSNASRSLLIYYYNIYIYISPLNKQVYIFDCLYVKCDIDKFYDKFTQQLNRFLSVST